MVPLLKPLMDRMAVLPVRRNCPFRRRRLHYLNARRRNAASRRAACGAAAGYEPAPLSTPFGHIMLGLIESLPEAIDDRLASRSEERRVGKEGRSRWSPYH